MGPSAQQPQQQQRRERGRTRGLLLAVWRGRLAQMLLASFIFSLGLSAVVPLLPTLATNFFASRRAGVAIDCEALVDHPPLACDRAHADVVRWTSLNSLAANTFIAFLFSPLVGDLSDSWGRKPFIVIGIALNALPLAAVWLHLARATSLLWYWPLNAVTAAVSPIIPMLSCTADVLAPELRTAGFGLVTASFSIGYMIGPSLGGLVPPAQAVLGAVGTLLASVLIVLVAVPESRPRAAPCAPAAALSGPSLTAVAAGAAVLAAPPPAAHQRHSPWSTFSSLGRSWTLINSSSLFRRLALCMAVVGIVSEGIQDMLLQYLQLTVGYTTADTALLLTVLGAANFGVQALLLPSLTRALGERRLLITGLLFSVTEQALLCAATSKAQALAAVSLSAPAGVAWPAISALKSMHASAEEQGLVQGALAGIRALASGVGPLLLAQLFASSTTAEAALGYHPALAFMMTCALTVVAAVVASSVSTIPEAAARLPAVLPAGSDAEDAEAPDAVDQRASDGCRAAAAWMHQQQEPASARLLPQKHSGDQQRRAPDQSAVAAGATAEAALSVATLPACAAVGAPPAAHDMQQAAAASGDILVVMVQGDVGANSSSCGGSSSWDSPPGSPLLRTSPQRGWRQQQQQQQHLTEPLLSDPPAAP